MSARVTVYPEQAAREALAASYDGRVTIASTIAEEARGTARVLTGAFRDGITVVADGEQVRVVDEDPLAAVKEYGTSDTAAQATLTDAARRHGRYSGVTPRR
ncbi:HK97 gp10 family phage protein [Actinosynnema pretiosum subsp. pretiosum]|uniref:HK97 gp10 family phage protein n=1 Tax=Actinosynnema pretiosum subsp. pretiosum TaxID=103721 RepID=A0AA45LE73_9PSEU|nr:HK97 gp10 family phage protein [Actinosynnema pretiosum subsp. pretiosum]